MNTNTTSHRGSDLIVSRGLEGSTAAVRQLVHTELSVPSRLGHVALLLAAFGMTAVVVSLWLTEPALPLRTHVAFGVLTAIGLSWSVFAIWVLTNRRVLFVRQRIVAGRMAVTFGVVFTIGALAIVAATGAAAALAAAVTGVVMVAVAVIILRRAHRASARLMARRDALERELAGSAR